MSVGHVALCQWVTSQLQKVSVCVWVCMCASSCIWSSLKSVWAEGIMQENEVIIAVDLYDTHYYLHSCDFTSVSADSMNNTCPHQKVTSSTFSFLICYFIKFISSLLTHVSRDVCGCVCKFGPFLSPRQASGLIFCHLPSSSTSSTFTLVVYEIAQQEMEECVCFTDNATPYLQTTDWHVVNFYSWYIVQLIS